VEKFETNIQQNELVELISNSDFLDFQKVEVTKVDDSKPWKPPLEVKVIKSNGEVVEGLDAGTPFFTFRINGQELTVSAVASGHINSLHIKAEDLGSNFDYSSLQELFEDIKDKLPEEILTANGPYAFSIDIGKNMGKEGLASLDELIQSGLVAQADAEELRGVKDTVFNLNINGSLEEKKSFISDFSAGNIKFNLVRGDILVPTIDLPKQPTTKLFMVFGPDGKGNKTLYTAAPGRNMPRHPNPNQHKDKDGKVNEETFKESSDAWIETVMLTGK
jgi:hypothetical protein